MEEIIWIIYKGFMAFVGVIKNNLFRVIFPILLVFIFGLIGWVLQNNYLIVVNVNSTQVFSSIATSLVALIAFVGVMVIFGFRRINREKKEIKNLIHKGVDSEYFSKELNNLTEGENLARDKMLKFSIYSFFIVILNLFFLIFSSAIDDNKFALAILFSDIALVGYSFYLVVRIASKILDSLPKNF